MNPSRTPGTGITWTPHRHRPGLPPRRHHRRHLPGHSLQYRLDGPEDAPVLVLGPSLGTTWHRL
ncbi:hypothetical protein GTW54_22935 [Streptomyces sp. SID5468]|nr:hypothetical protein [Streptomyces sp. SID5468]